MKSFLTRAWNASRVGVWSGLFAALALIAVSLALRWAAGIGTLPELLGDRIAPLLGLHFFFFLIGFFHGYAHLKQFGIVSMLLNELIAGIVLGLFYAWQQRSTSTQASAHEASRAPRQAQTRLIGVVAVLFVGLSVFLWGNLQANYLGLPPNSARPASLAGLALSAVVFTAALLWSNRKLTEAPAPNASPAEASSDTGRRDLLVAGGSSLMALFSLGILARFYSLSTYSYDGTVNAGPDLPPVTPNDKFYSVTKNNLDPMPTLAAWALEVKGDVRKPLKLRLHDLQTMPSAEQQTTLQCISNPIGGALSSNAVWKGVPLRDLLSSAGASAAARQVMVYGADGFVDTIPMDAALHPYTLVVHTMNGADLPEHHGYPVRLIVPGYVGEKSVKWLTALEVREQPGEGFYEKQGWGPHFTIENASRFDAPEDGGDVKLRQAVQLKGTAFAGDRGVRAVQVSLDNGDTWQTTQLTYPGTRLTWAQWAYAWTPSEAGDTTLLVRCIDGAGGIQSPQRHAPGPGEAGGYQELNLTVHA